MGAAPWPLAQFLRVLRRRPGDGGTSESRATGTPGSGDLPGSETVVSRLLVGLSRGVFVGWFGIPCVLHIPATRDAIVSSGSGGRARLADLEESPTGTSRDWRCGSSADSRRELLLRIGMGELS